MGDVIKGIGKLVSAPVRGIGHALSTSGIPGLTNVGGVAENLGNAVAGKGSFFGGVGKAVKSGAPLALGALAGPLAGGLGSLLGGGGSGGGGLGGIVGKIGRAVSSPNILGNAEGKLDLGKVIGAGGAISNVLGARRQRKSAENYANASTNQRNELMSKILAPQDYGVGQ